MNVKFLIHRDFGRNINKFGLKKRLGSIVSSVANWIDSNFTDYGKNIQRVDAVHKLYKVRAGDNFRLFFKLSRDASSGTTAIYLLRIMNHDQSDQVHRSPELLKTGNSQDFSQLELIDEVDLNESDQLLQPTYSNLFYDFAEADFARVDQADYQLWWHLNDDQQALCQQKGPVILCGSAGSGKTTIALYRLMLWKNQDFSSQRSSHQTDSQAAKSLYVTYSDKLKNYAEGSYRLLRRSEINVDFMTIQELCMQHSGEDCRFNKDQYIDFIRFDEFVLTRNRSGFSSDMLWEEFRGVIKGCYFLTKDLTRSSISLAEYQDLNRIGMAKDRDALFAEADRAQIYKLFKLYQAWLKKEGLWDDLDLSKQALLNVRQQYPQGLYDQVIVDEVQDLTIYQVQLLLNLAKNPEGVFLTGDVHQSIYPSRFRWERLTQQVYEFYQAKYTPLLRVIDKNYRSVQPIVDLCNTIARFRHEQFRDELFEVTAVQQAGGKIGWLSVGSAKTILQDQSVPADTAIIIADPQSDDFDDASTFNFFEQNQNATFRGIHDSKGLEYKTVLIFGFFDAYLADLVADRPQRVSNTFAYMQRYRLNLLNVACTRAIDELIFVDDCLWDNIRVAAGLTVNAADSLQRLEAVLARQSSAEDWILRAQQLEQNENWLQAAKTWEKVETDHPHEAARCYAMHYQQLKQWQQAAQYFMQAALYVEAAQAFQKANLWIDAGNAFNSAQLYARAAECFDREGAITEMLASLLQGLSDPTCINMLYQLLEKKEKIGKLGGMISQSLFEAIVADGSLVPVHTLFAYSKVRHQLVREAVRVDQKNIHRHLVTGQNIQQLTVDMQQMMSSLQGLVVEGQHAG